MPLIRYQCLNFSLSPKPRGFRKLSLHKNRREPRTSKTSFPTLTPKITKNKIFKDRKWCIKRELKSTPTHLKVFFRLTIFTIFTGRVLQKGSWLFVLFPILPLNNGEFRGLIKNIFLGELRETIIGQNRFSLENYAKPS